MSNFVFPIRGPIGNDRVKLIPFKPNLHSTTFVAQTWRHPEMLAHMVSGPFSTVNDFERLMTQPASVSIFSASSENLLFAIIDKTEPPSPEDDEGQLAGVTGYTDASKENMSAEIYMSE